MHLFIIGFYLLALVVLLHETGAQVPCESDDFCRRFLNSTNSVCLPDAKTCSNGFQKGCLRTLIGDSRQKRVCNSDDVENSDSCRPADFKSYPELRIHNANWLSSTIQAWIYQILLMEFVHTPATVGLTTSATSTSGFYSEEYKFAVSPQAYPYPALEQANRVGNCAETEMPCVDVLPEVWEGQQADYLQLVINGTIEPPAANGLLGRSGLHIPAHTARQYPNLAIWYGLAGEENRQLLAETFLRPMTWLEFCNEISSSNCLTETESAARFPKPEEEDMYFVAGLYSGHFAATEENECTANSTCTGHVVTPPCDWSAPIDSQLFWNNIVGLERDGPLMPNGGYTQDQMVQIWRAANATRSHVIMHWYEPEANFVEFAGSDYEFQPVAFPVPSMECLTNRANREARCSSDAEIRRGEEAGSCGDNIQTLQRLIARSVGTETLEQMDVDQSPAYAMLRNVRITNIDIQAIIERIIELNNDPFGNDSRQAVCEWVVKNEARIKDFIPLGYPREIVSQSEYSAWYLVAAKVVGGIAASIAFVGFWAVAKYRNTKTMIFAQPIFLHLILFGMCLISIGAVINATSPSRSTCTSAAWLLLLGYTIEMVPVLVKTNKINKLIRSSRKHKRISLSRQAMMLEVAGVVVLVIGFLISWTIADPPGAETVRTLMTADDRNIVNVDVRCGSKFDYWKLLAFVWEAILLILAAFLAFQSRDIMKELNESVSLAIMVYSHFLFSALRGVFYVFYVQDIISASVIAALFSFNYAVDAVAAMAIYVLPKILAANKSPETYTPGMVTNFGSTMVSEDAGMNEDQDEPMDSKLKLLVCSGNLGNTEPEMDSLEQWIPLGGACDRIEPMEDKDMPSGTFGMIAIGMQEATWSDSKNRNASFRGESLSEEDVLQALEEANTAQLRDMVQEVLGDRYFLLVAERRGQMRLQIWATRRVAANVSDVKISGANTGVGNLLSNKGGIVISLNYRQTRMSFVSAHLAAHEGESYYKARCDSIRSILKEAQTFDSTARLDVAVSSHHCFFFGDLNFRTRFNEEKKFEDNVKLATDLISFKDFDSLYAFDELHEGLANGDFLLGFETLKCDFAPTFKVEKQPGFIYQQRRMPSWTDRVLYRSLKGLEENLEPISYEACPDHVTSDHKPIRSAFCLTPNDELGTNNVDSEALLTFHQLQCSDLPASTSSGTSDPFLMFIWDAVELQWDNQAAAFDIFRKYFGVGWPRTQSISKTRNPNWEGECITLRLRNTRVGSDGMLFLVALNRDLYMRRHDVLGVATLNVKDLLTMTCTEPDNQFTFSRELSRDGKLAGNISFKLGIKRKTVQSRRRSSVLGFNFPRRSSQGSFQTGRSEISEALRVFHQSEQVVLAQRDPKV